MFSRKTTAQPCVDFKGVPHLTADEFKEEADINFLLARYCKTGNLYTADEMLRAKARPRFGDFTGIPDYHDALNKMQSALELFETLPLAVRQRFHDSPVQLLAFLQDTNNRAEAISLGLIAKDNETSEQPPVTTTTTQEEKS